MRAIARVLGVPVGTVHKVLSEQMTDVVAVRAREIAQPSATQA
ncbi:hypothetical protein [Isoptericola croceus]|nr:hypothetical protein [Isoptericola croceus]